MIGKGHTLPMKGPESGMFKQIQRFWRASQPFGHPAYPEELPFSRLIDFKALKGKKVLEIGCGMGAHAALLSQAGAIVTGIDLTERSVYYTKRRLKLFKIKNATVIRCDAESLPFEGESFDFVWSWGVIHHSVNTQNIVNEIFRVLKTDGRVSVMVYHRNSTRYFITGGLYYGLLRGRFWQHPSLYAVNMTFTDGYIARHYTRQEAALLFSNFRKVNTKIMGVEIPSMLPGYGKLTQLCPLIMKPVNHWISTHWGWFLLAEAQK